MLARLVKATGNDMELFRFCRVLQSYNYDLISASQTNLNGESFPKAVWCGDLEKKSSYTVKPKPHDNTEVLSEISEQNSYWSGFLNLVKIDLLIIRILALGLTFLFYEFNGWTRRLNRPYRWLWNAGNQMQMKAFQIKMKFNEKLWKR